MFSFNNTGYTKLTCLNTKNEFILNNKDEFWNKEIKKSFIERVTNLWDRSLYTEGVSKEQQN